MAAVPDFRQGGMENWGLIVYGETDLLYDPRESSTRNKQNVALIVSHELAHQVCRVMKENSVLPLISGFLFREFITEITPVSVILCKVIRLYVQPKYRQHVAANKRLERMVKPINKDTP